MPAAASCGALPARTVAEDLQYLDKDDLVQFDEKVWIVGRVNSEQVQKNAEFGRRVSNKTIIELDKGK